MALAAFPAPYSSGASIARIGPNAIIQVARVLRDRLGEPFAARLLFESTGYALGALPSAMVDEAEARRLSAAVVHALGERDGTRVLREAGHHTGDYLLAHRIPRPAQWIIRAAPRRLGLALLLQAMRANAWTFAGSGAFHVTRHAAGADLVFHACAMCRDLASTGPVCDFYAGTFERLVRVLVAPRATVQEISCQAQGGGACHFVVDGIH